MKILVVDDDPVSRLVLDGALQDFGHSTIQVENGKEAWDLIVEDPPQVLIADWMMPELDGIELCRLVRGHDSVRYVYVILLTSRRDKEDRLEGLRAGADDFLIKPLDRGELAARLSVAERILRVEGALRQANTDLADAREHELEIGAEIQRALLTGQVPASTPQFEFSALSIPSKHIDGDFYDVFVHNDGVVDVVLGDAMGKGIPAALVSAGTKNALLRMLNELKTGAGRLPDVETIVQRANNEVAPQLIRLGSFVTLAYARLDADNKTAKIVDGGHTKVVVWRHRERRLEVIEGAGNFPLGFQEFEEYAPVEISVEPRDVLLFYSDGVTEAQAASGELFGVDRMYKVLANCGDMSPDLLLRSLRESVHRFTSSDVLSDDLTCLVVRCMPGFQPWERLQITLDSDLESLWALREFVVQAGEDVGIVGDQAHDLRLAVHEAATNVVRHAHKGLENQMIDVVALRLSDSAIRIEVRYLGPSFERSVKEPPDLDNLRGHGLGLYLIEQCVDEVQYKREGDVNVVAMTVSAH